MTADITRSSGLPGGTQLGIFAVLGREESACTSSVHPHRIDGSCARCLPDLTVTFP